MGHTRHAMATTRSNLPTQMVVARPKPESTVIQMFKAAELVLLWWSTWSVLIFLTFKLIQTKEERQKNGILRLACAAIFLGAIWPYYFGVYVWGMTAGEAEAKHWNRTHS